MKRISIILLVIVTVVLASCNGRADCKPNHVELAKYIITDFDPPKHVYVDLKRVVDGRQFTHVYVAKHCNNWRENFSIGDTITLTRYTYIDGGTEIIEFNNNEIYDYLCH
jgi:hypothetical protein